jgi:hypothetical protein|eukprot:CAMPEP_0174381008 /NCGR_PEP_ID=MMETSP0811_2-20130205/123729_1 /TAXON_ID=73025 ORGANISM="Eutreptiella gymnastica-like, Strain CCMP1594" /NCGR_SAMPLE_ID=MMETSP0811_2 /ASSEMBLY_ACC=CAM_ASM_000667 /LENGTH=67 /DNA_ID=CAMNT_0015534019 /DNA_START=619 /DNA_END=822 /DNA_ORIENTATION=-
MTGGVVRLTVVHYGAKAKCTYCDFVVMVADATCTSVRIILTPGFVLANNVLPTAADSSLQPMPKPGL